jgi:hypothetical protein
MKVITYAFTCGSCNFKLGTDAEAYTVAGQAPWHLSSWCPGWIFAGRVYTCTASGFATTYVTCCELQPGSWLQLEYTG